MNFPSFILAVFFNVVSVCFAVTMTCYSDSSCAKKENVCHWVSNPLHLPTGKCVDIIKTGSMKIGVEIEKCSGTYVESAVYDNGCGSKSSHKNDGHYIGKCIGSDGIYYKAEC